MEVCLPHSGDNGIDSIVCVILDGLGSGGFHKNPNLCPSCEEHEELIRLRFYEKNTCEEHEELLRRKLRFYESHHHRLAFKHLDLLQKCGFRIFWGRHCCRL